MEIQITTFTNPFSFHCRIEDATRDIEKCMETFRDADGSLFGKKKPDLSRYSDAEYVAVMWESKWARGIITTTNQLLIWLIDDGVYIRPNENTQILPLPEHYKNIPSMVFEASIHGVTPIDKVVSFDCQIHNQVATSWNKGAIEKAKTVISNAVKKYFMPIAILTTKFNKIVIGDLYLQTEDNRLVNIVDNLEMWPIFLEKNPETYIKEMPVYYSSCSKHQGEGQWKSYFRELQIPIINIGISFKDYTALCEKGSLFQALLEYESDSEDGSTVTYLYHHGSCVSKSTRNHSIVSTYVESKTTAVPSIKDEIRHKNDSSQIPPHKDWVLEMCRKYQDFDSKGLGRASRHRRLC